jgi:hypothetical protein
VPTAPSLYPQQLLNTGPALPRLVDALRSKTEIRGFDTRWYQWMFSLTLSFRPHYGPGIDSASNRNQHREYIRGGGGRLKVAGALWADNITAFMCRQSWKQNPETSNSWNPQGLCRPVMGELYLYLVNTTQEFVCRCYFVFTSLLNINLLVRDAVIICNLLWTFPRIFLISSSG